MRLKNGVSSSFSSRISVFFLVSGALSIFFSIFFESQIFALIGLGLVFWGALFLLARPVKLVEASLLYNTSMDTYLTTDRIIEEFNYEGKGYYIPPYPQDVYLPEYLKGLKSYVVFISAKSDGQLPSIEEIAKGKFLSKNNKGVLLAPPGSGILTQIEGKSKVNFSKTDLGDLCDMLPTFIIQDLNLAKELNMKLEGDQVYLAMVDPLYKNFYDPHNNLKSINFLGCPIVSAIASAVSKASGRPVIIQKQELSPDRLAIKVTYQILQG